MSEATPTELTDKDKVTIYLAEYTTLRNEVVARINTRWTFLGIAAAVMSVLISGKVENWILLILALSLTLLTLTYCLWQTWFFILRCVKRIREIERAVNALAHEEILVWETRMKDERQKKEGVNVVMSTDLDKD